MIDSKSPYKFYAGMLLIILVLPLIALSIGGIFYFQPYWGPLTRIGGYLENDYGWNEPQEEFFRPLSTIARSLAEYDHYYDVVVVGDSFSYDEKKGWQNYFVDETRYSVITLNHNIGLSKIVESEVFKIHPPRYLIFESLEQFSLARLSNYNSLHDLPTLPVEKSQVTFDTEHVDQDVTRAFVKRDEIPPHGSETFDSNETRISQALNSLLKGIARIYTNQPSSDQLRSSWESSLENSTFMLPLRIEGEPLFTNHRSRSLLVYSLDVTKPTADILVSKAAEGAWRMKRAVEANGKTKVLTMIFPDKLTVYAPYLADPSVAPPSIIPPLAQAYPYQLRLDEVFAKAVASGVQDLYLPDDTHCGYMGYKLAAERLALELKGLNE